MVCDSEAGEGSEQRGRGKWITPPRECAFLDVFADVRTCAFCVRRAALGSETESSCVLAGSGVR